MSVQELEIPLDAQRFAAGVQAHAAHQRRESPAYLACKRAFDILASVFAMILISPFIAILVVLIKLEDPAAPALFSQTRIGKNGKPFKMFKLRSMVANAEQLLPELLKQNEISGLMFKMKKDPRITRVGKFIRRTSLDELPQFFNVLRGDMSLVGPRPPLPREVKDYTSYDMQRLLVKPGCTGLWQISGRNSIGFEKMVELDLKYIRERGFLLDVVILFKTFKALFGSKHAF